MSTSSKALEQIEFHGINTNGNPTKRPRGTAARCVDFRLMPGFWPRLRGGRKARNYTADTLMRIHAFRDIDTFGASNHLAQIKKASGTAANWNWFALSTYVIDPFGVEPIATANDSGFALTNPCAVTNLPDRPLFYNGLGVRSADSKPPFSTYFQGTTRYFGLDAFCPSGKPTVSWSAGGGGYNSILTQEGVSIWIGLYHQPTGHFSNAIYCGKVTNADTAGVTGVISVSNLNRLTAAYHGVTEQNELFYVFYATIDGGSRDGRDEVAYLIYKADLTGPETATLGTGTKSLSLSNNPQDINGWYIDKTKETPIDNFPPRPMRDIAYVNGRLYGALMTGGSGSGTDFHYQPESREKAAVVWSRSSGDLKDTEFVGDPLQSWPLTNIEYTPDGNQPVAVVPAPDEVNVVVITPAKTFLLEELDNSIHSFTVTISHVHGILNRATLQITDRGIIWVNQRNEIVILPKGSLQVQILSGDYQDKMGAPRCAMYKLDPLNQVDQYEVFLADGTSVTHDFFLGGEAYTSTGQDFTAAQMCVDSSGIPHFIVAKNGIYTKDAQPDDGTTPSRDETYTTYPTVATTEINGQYERNWDDFGDPTLRKEIRELFVVGDGANSVQLSASPLTVEIYQNYQQVISGNKEVARVRGVDQFPAYMFRADFTKHHAFAWKFLLKLAGHATDDSSFTQHVPFQGQGDRAKNFYGAINNLLFEVGISENRP